MGMTRRAEAHSPVVAERDEQPDVAGVVELLGRHQRLRLVGDGGEVVLPASVVAVLERSAPELAAGHAVAVTSVDALLTTQEAAELLGVSRPFLVRLLDDGTIPSSKAGTHRRVRFEGVAEYKRQRDAERLAVLDEMTAEAEELGLRY